MQKSNSYQDRARLRLARTPEFYLKFVAAYQAGKRVLITDPREINDPLSDILIALGDEVKCLKTRVERLDGELQQATPKEPAQALADEQAESAQYRSEQLDRSDFLTMGEGI